MPLIFTNLQSHFLSLNKTNADKYELGGNSRSLHKMQGQIVCKGRIQSYNKSCLEIFTCLFVANDMNIFFS